MICLGVHRQSVERTFEPFERDGGAQNDAFEAVAIVWKIEDLQWHMQIAVSEQRPQSRMAQLVWQDYWGQTINFLNAIIFPQDVEELDEDLKFSWSFLKAIDLKTEAKRQLDRVHAQLTKERTPAQVEHPQEVWLHDDHTKGQRDQERKERAWNFNRQKDAAKRGEEANAYLLRQKHARKKRRRRGSSNNTESEGSTEVSSHHVLNNCF